MVKRATKIVNGLAQYLDACGETLTLHDLQVLNQQILSALEWDVAIADDQTRLLALFAKLQAFWRQPDSLDVLDKLNDEAWAMCDDFSPQKTLSRYDRTLLRILLTTTYAKSDKAFFEESLEYLELWFSEL
ncbi:hypothetical protein [Neisseria perflava]|uniref:hypothetical protein n=1 Tax=Neisseria perflava TaxID=33053 RepID=UPI00209DD8DF|nr:hypothetical protein [Neisseria perflava]MCP1661326.1 hypothetical protein [Neisseria perflava]MCP1773438.1 hypothetical protein [Neisseria perflava]